ncbi:putative lipase 1 [[Candida] railenensis]|uniref:Lipase 1 n=1 Tax=[Candida] railenensis TaxID=45579 RepID=A0A9P0W1B6_9ASCO|nr:putative lipase 1 [[Candida] railenensis]
MKFVLLIILFLQSIIAAPIIDISKRASILKPSEDPFYTGPEGYEDQPLGSVLRIRKMDTNYGFVVLPIHVESVYQILVRSEDTFKQPIAVMSTLFVPYNPDPSKLVSYQVAQDASCFDCAPSYAMQIGSSPLSWVTSELEEALFVTSLVDGYYVLVPDHEGPKATYVAGWSAAYAVMNAIRGTFNSANVTGINEDADVVLWGYSGGAFATGWGASVQPTYYPELNLVGSAMGGIPVNISNVAVYDMGSVFAGLVVMAINGLKNEYPELKELMQEKMGSEKYAKFAKADNYCLIESVLVYAFADFSDYLDEGNQILYDSTVKNITDHNNLLTNGLTPSCPLFIYSSENDEIIPIEDTDALVESYCEQGVSVEYRKDRISDHIITAVSGAGLAFNFIKDRFNGVEVNPSCQSSTSTSDFFDEGSLSGLGEIGSGLVSALVGDKIGPGVTSNDTSSSSFFSSILSAGEGLVSDVLGSSSDSSNSTSSGILSTLLSSGEGLVSSLLGSSSSSNSTSGGVISSLLSSGENFVSSLLGSSSSSNSNSTSGSVISTLESAASNLVGDLGGSNSSSSSSTISNLLSTGSTLISNFLKDV